MTTNTLRLQILADILKADAATLHQVDAILQAAHRATHLDQVEDPDWISIASLARQLHRHPAHLRRLLTRDFALHLETHPTASGQLALHLRRALIPEVARATVRHTSAKRERKSRAQGDSACLAGRAHLEPANCSPASNRRVELDLPAGPPSKIDSRATAQIPAPSKLSASPAQ